MRRPRNEELRALIEILLAIVAVVAIFALLSVAIAILG